MEVVLHGRNEGSVPAFLPIKPRFAVASDGLVRRKEVRAWAAKPNPDEFGKAKSLGRRPYP